MKPPFPNACGSIIDAAIPGFASKMPLEHEWRMVNYADTPLKRLSEDCCCFGSPDYAILSRGAGQVGLDVGEKESQGERHRPRRRCPLRHQLMKSKRNVDGKTIKRS